jgi:hypothetical protein
VTDVNSAPPRAARVFFRVTRVAQDLPVGTVGRIIYRVIIDVIDDGVIFCARLPAATAFLAIALRAEIPGFIAFSG